jgi:hypothetical protein
MFLQLKTAMFITVPPFNRNGYGSKSARIKTGVSTNNNICRNVKLNKHILSISLICYVTLWYLLMGLNDGKERCA